MAMNNVNLVGRVAQNLHITQQKDGGALVMFNLAVARNYKDEDGNTPADFIPVKAFVPDRTKMGGWDYVEKGSLISISASLRSSVYEKNGETIYSTDVVMNPYGLDLLESKAAAHARKAGEAAE